MMQGQKDLIEDDSNVILGNLEVTSDLLYIKYKMLSNAFYLCNGHSS